MEHHHLNKDMEHHHLNKDMEHHPLNKDMVLHHLNKDMVPHHLCKDMHSLHMEPNPHMGMHNQLQALVHQVIICLYTTLSILYRMLWHCHCSSVDRMVSMW